MSIKISAVRSQPSLFVANVRFGSKADIAALPIDVRFTPKSGHQSGGSRRSRNQVLDHRQTEGSSCLAIAISALPLASLIFRFAVPRLQKARALLGSSPIASLKSAMALPLSPLCTYRTPRFLKARALLRSSRIASL